MLSDSRQCFEGGRAIDDRDAAATLDRRCESVSNPLAMIRKATADDVSALVHIENRAFVTDLVSGTVRMRGALDYLIAAVADRPLPSLDARVRAGLRLGAYQLVGGVPPHAAVSATVDAAGGRARGYVNAVLRRLATVGPPWPWPTGDAPDALAVRTSHPRWLVQRLIDDLGADEALGVLDSDNRPPALTLRPRRGRATADQLAAELREAGAAVEAGRLVDDALVVRGVGDPAQLPAVIEGRATPQDEASQAVSALVEARSGDLVLDVAAAPGGKATAIAEGGACVVALDADLGRLRMVGDAAHRLGVGVLRVVADGRALPVRRAAFDRVIVDAPCSGLGVLRRRPDARWRLSPAMIPELGRLQCALLAAASEAVAPGGLLIYSVCTLSTEETVEIDRWARSALGDFESAESPSAPWRPVGRGALLLPQERGTDGMYVLALRRNPPGASR